MLTSSTAHHKYSLFRSLKVVLLCYICCNIYYYFNQMAGVTTVANILGSTPGFLKCHTYDSRPVCYRSHSS